MTAFQIILMGLLIICAVSVSFSKNLLNAILIYMSFSLVMSMLWICLGSGHHGSCCRRRHHQRPLFRDTEKNPCHRSGGA